MILGILSDTHGQRQRTAGAIRLLRRVGAEAFVHCGDVGGSGVLDELAGLRIWGVCGNIDSWDAKIVRQAASLGVVIAANSPLRIELEGRALAVFHGHEPQFTRLVEETLEHGVLPAGFGHCDYVLHGHTHVACDGFLGPVRVINPGALHRAATHTVATLDLQADTVRFWQVREDVPDMAPAQIRP